MVAGPWACAFTRPVLLTVAFGLEEAQITCPVAFPAAPWPRKKNLVARSCFVSPLGMLLPEAELIASRSGPQFCCAAQLACDRTGKLAAQSASANNAADRVGASIDLERLGHRPWGVGRVKCYLLWRQKQVRQNG